MSNLNYLYHRWITNYFKIYLIKVKFLNLTQNPFKLHAKNFGKSRSAPAPTDY